MSVGVLDKLQDKFELILKKKWKDLRGNNSEIVQKFNKISKKWEIFEVVFEKYLKIVQKREQ